MVFTSSKRKLSVGSGHLLNMSDGENALKGRKKCLLGTLCICEQWVGAHRCCIQAQIWDGTTRGNWTCGCSSADRTLIASFKHLLSFFNLSDEILVEIF